MSPSPPATPRPPFPLSTYTLPSCPLVPALWEESPGRGGSGPSRSSAVRRGCWECSRPADHAHCPLQAGDPAGCVLHCDAWTDPGAGKGRPSHLAQPPPPSLIPGPTVTCDPDWESETPVMTGHRSECGHWWSLREKALKASGSMNGFPLFPMP